MSQQGVPKKIKIGYADFKLTPRSAEWGRRKKATGQCIPTESLIEYDKSKNPEELTNTIIHEIFHGLVYVFDIKFRTVREEEGTVRKLANGLHTVIRDNPQLIKWILKNSSKS